MANIMLIFLVPEYSTSDLMWLQIKNCTQILNIFETRRCTFFFRFSSVRLIRDAICDVPRDRDLRESLLRADRLRRVICGRVHPKNPPEGANQSEDLTHSKKKKRGACTDESMLHHGLTTASVYEIRRHVASRSSRTWAANSGHIHNIGPFAEQEACCNAPQPPVATDLRHTRL